MIWKNKGKQKTSHLTVIYSASQLLQQDSSPLRTALELNRFKMALTWEPRHS